MTDPIQRQRNTSRTQRRAENMRKLIERFEGASMTCGDVADFFGFSASGARKYLLDLRITGVIELSHREGITDTFIGTPVWKLADDLEAREKFLLGLGAFRSDTVKNIAPRIKAKDDPTRHIHILADDQHYSVKASRAPVVRDPLIAAFFGPAKTNT